MTMDSVATNDIGGRLRSAREQRALSLYELARRTKLSVAVLQAIEGNDFASLPAGMFRKAYVRTLAVEVGLDPGDIAADYCVWFEPPDEPLPVPSRDATRHEQWLKQLTPSPRHSLVTLIALTTLTTAWFLVQGAIRPEAPDRNTVSTFGEAAIPPVAVTALTDPPRDAATPTAIGQTADAPLRIELAATGWCWLAADSDGERVLYRLVKPGERLVLKGRRIISLRLGDAGAVTLSINDGPRRSLGRDGEVAQLEVTPDNVKALRDVAAETVS